MTERRNERDLDAGDFIAWLGRMSASLSGQGDAGVPCGDCCACCSSSHFIHVEPEEVGALARIPPGLLFPAPGRSGGALVMGYDEQGRCPMLGGDGRCSIYEDRPLTCRTYDCRVFAAAGVTADCEAITRRTRRWRFGHPTRADHEAHAAVEAAARFVRERPDCFPGGAAPRDPVGVALLAIEGYDVFLGRPEGPPEGECTTADRDIARAVLAAKERFETARRA